MTPLRYHSSNLPLITLETMRLLVQTALKMLTGIGKLKINETMLILRAILPSVVFIGYH